MSDELLTYLYEVWCKTPEGAHFVMDGNRTPFERKVAAFRKWLGYFRPGTASVLFGFIAEFHRQEERQGPVVAELL